MCNYLRNDLIKAIQVIVNLLLLCSIILINNCNCDNQPSPPPPTPDKPNNIPNEIIMFLGNPGVGKSTLYNSIFLQAIFKSGNSFGTALTTHQQEYIYDNKLYIDTPGVDDIDENRRAQAGIEIGQALKHNMKYKIIFVAGLESGRIRVADLVTINLICDAIKIDFEYGIIFNKVSETIINGTSKITPLGTKGEKENFLHQHIKGLLHKKPSSVIILEEAMYLKDKSNVYFQTGDENRKYLLDFLNGLKATQINKNDVEIIDTRTFEAKYRDMEVEYAKEVEQLKKKLRELKG